MSTAGGVADQTGCDAQLPSTSSGATGSGSKRLRNRSDSWPSCRRTERNFLARSNGPQSVHTRRAKWSPLVDSSVSYSLSSKCLLKHCANWNFDSFLLNRVSSGHPVISLGAALFEAYDLRRHFQLDWTRLINCFRLVELGYEGNLFHNAVHAADVMQAMHCLLQDERLIDCLTPFEKLLCLMAALGHDLYHPGVNQHFLHRTKHFLSGLYESSVLENHHWRCFISLLKESHVFDHFPSNRWLELIDVLKVLILSTDMQRQQEYLASFKLFLRTEKSTALAGAASSRKLMQQPLSYHTHGAGTHRWLRYLLPHHKVLIMQIVLKCADISNVARPRAVSRLWSPVVTTEFFRQGDEERRLGLSVTEFCDRTKSSVAEIQWGFMEHLAAPLFHSWADFISSPLSEQMIFCLNENQNYWKSELDRQKRVDKPVEEMVNGRAKNRRDLSGTRSRMLKSNRRISLPASNSSARMEDKQRRISLPVCYYGAAVTKWSVLLKGERNFQDLCEIESYDRRDDVETLNNSHPTSLPLSAVDEVICNHKDSAGPFLRVSHSVGEFSTPKLVEPIKKMSVGNCPVLEDIYETGCSPKSDCFDCYGGHPLDSVSVTAEAVAPGEKLKKCRRHSAPVLFQPNGLWRIYVETSRTDRPPPDATCADVCTDEWKCCRQGRRSSAPMATTPQSTVGKSADIPNGNRHSSTDCNGDGSDSSIGHMWTAVG